MLMKDENLVDVDAGLTQQSRNTHIGIVVVCSLAILLVVRTLFINPFDSWATRYGCINHAESLNEQELNVESGADFVKEWTVIGHVRSNKIGFFDRDSASCLLSSNDSTEDNLRVSMSEANRGGFYLFAKFLGLVAQVGLISGFVRWYIYRFVDKRLLE